MERHLDFELIDLKRKLLLMGGSVESQLQDVLQALIKRDSDLAIRVVENDMHVNTLDVDIDETCLRLLALHHPTAGDLRFITTIMKISAELERMSDLAKNIAERAIELNEEPQLKPYIDISRMAEWTIQMVKECLDAFVNRDAELARKVCRDDDFVDDLTEQLFRELVYSCWKTQELSRVRPASRSSVSITSGSPTMRRTSLNSSSIWWKARLSGTCRPSDERRECSRRSIHYP